MKKIYHITIRLYITSPLSRKKSFWNPFAHWASTFQFSVSLTKPHCITWPIAVQCSCLINYTITRLLQVFSLAHWTNNQLFSLAQEQRLLAQANQTWAGRGFIKFLCRRSVGFFSRAFLVFLMKESKKRRWKQLGKLMAKSRSQPVNMPGAWPLMNPLPGFFLPCPLPLP